MTDQEIAELANRLTGMIANAPHPCHYAERIVKMEGKVDAIGSSMAKICEKQDQLINAVAEMRGSRNIMVAVIGAVGLVIGAAISAIAGLFR